MSFVHALRHRLRVLLHPGAHERELAEEMEFHLGLEAMQQEHAAHGALSVEEAHLTARRQFGNITYYREETRRITGIAWLDGIDQDVRFALRSFRRAPTFTAVAVVMLALGLGANTAIFSVVDALLLRPLPFKEPDRLLLLSLTPSPGARTGWSYPKYALLRDARPSVFSDVSLVSRTEHTIRVGDEAVRDWGESIDAHYFPTLGVRVALGRNLFGQEGRPGGPRVVILSEALWRRAFDADPSALGQSMLVDGSPYTIVGVAPPRFAGFSGAAAFWIPVHALPEAWASYDLGPYNHTFEAIGRLAPGASLGQARTAIGRVGTAVDAIYPSARARDQRWSATADHLDDFRVTGRVRRTLVVLMGAVGLVLLIACANVANLFLVRAAGRRREIAVRLAIGAGRGRLVRQLIVESMLLALLGGVASLAVAWWTVKALASLESASVLQLQIASAIAGSAAVELNVAAFAFTFAAAVGTGLVFGLVPALQATRFSLTGALADESATVMRGLRGLASRNVLVVAEIALAIVLLAGSGLMLRSLGRLLAVRPGFDARNVLTMQVNRAPEWSRDSIVRFYDLALERLAAIPGVSSVALADCPPLNYGCAGRAPIELHDRRSSTASAPVFGIHWITPGWPSVLRVPLLKGRMLTDADDRSARKVVLVSASAARRLWPGEDPIGRRVMVPVDRFEGDTAYVVGVIGDVLHGRLDSLPVPDLYVSYYQSPISFRMRLFLRTEGDPAAIVPVARQVLREVAPGFPIHAVSTLESIVDQSTASARFGAVALGTFAALALLLAAVGTYGVISYAVTQRRREIGVRVALGATHSDVVRLVVGQGLRLAAAGVAVGLVAAFMATRVLRSLLFGVAPTDPTTLIAIVTTLGFAVLAASWLPARRAAGVPAAEVLRAR